MSDNGGLVHLGANDTRRGYTSSGGWAGGKNSPLEGGHRTPFIASWPAKIPAGTVRDDLVVNTDILATMAALVGTDIPPTEAMDSRNLLPLLLGGELEDRKHLLLQAGSNCEVMYRRDPWKLIIKSNWQCDTWIPKSLFNLEKTPMEKPSDNQINHPETKALAEELFDEYLKIRKSGEPTTPK